MLDRYLYELLLSITNVSITIIAGFMIIGSAAIMTYLIFELLRSHK